MWYNKQFTFPSSDPISQSVLNNMTPIERFPISKKLSVIFFLDNVSALRILEYKLKDDPANREMNLLIGNIYQKKGDFDKAKRYHKKASVIH